MISTESEYQGAQRDLQYLKEFLTRAERSPEHPNKDLTLIGIYKKMYHVWEELEEYYRARLAQMEAAERAEEQREAASAVVSKSA